MNCPGLPSVRFRKPPVGTSSVPRIREKRPASSASSCAGSAARATRSLTALKRTLSPCLTTRADHGSVCRPTRGGRFSLRPRANREGFELEAAPGREAGDDRSLAQVRLDPVEHRRVGKCRDDDHHDVGTRDDVCRVGRDLPQSDWLPPRVPVDRRPPSFHAALQDCGPCRRTDEPIDVTVEVPGRHSCQRMARVSASTDREDASAGSGGPWGNHLIVRPYPGPGRWCVLQGQRYNRRAGSCVICL